LSKERVRERLSASGDAYGEPLPALAMLAPTSPWTRRGDNQAMQGSALPLVTRLMGEIIADHQLYREGQQYILSAQVRWRSNPRRRGRRQMEKG